MVSCNSNDFASYMMRKIIEGSRKIHGYSAMTTGSWQASGVSHRANYCDRVDMCVVSVWRIGALLDRRRVRGRKTPLVLVYTNRQR